MADAVEVTLPGGESLGECGVVALALSVGVSKSEQACVGLTDGQCRRRETHVSIGDVIRATKSVHSRLGDRLRKVIVAKETRAEDTNGGDSVVVLHLVRLSATTAETSSHDARAVHIETVRSADDPIDGFVHPLSSGLAVAAISARCARSDGDETVRGDIGQEVLGRGAVVAAGSVAPDEDRHWVLGSFAFSWGIDGVPGEGVVRGERYWSIGPTRE